MGAESRHEQMFENASLNRTDKRVTDDECDVAAEVAAVDYDGVDDD